MPSFDPSARGCRPHGGGARGAGRCPLFFEEMIDFFSMPDPNDEMFFS